MTQTDLVQFLGTIAKSNTSEFLNRVQEVQKDGKEGTSMSYLIVEQFSVGFYSSFLVADKVVIASKNNADDQYIWELDSASFNVFKDPREGSTLEEIIRKYSKFINFNIYLWKSNTIKEEVPDYDAADNKKTDETEKKTDDDDAAVEDDKEEEKKAKTKTVDKTVWDWELMNERAPFDLFSNYNKKADAIKLYVRRVFITDNFEEMIPKYLPFIRGVIDSDDLPLNVSREILQQSKLLKVIKKKTFSFWKEYGTNIKRGVIEDSANCTRLAKLLRYATSLSGDKQISLSQYVKCMKLKQEHIYFIAAMSIDEAQKSPFIERIPGQ
ncbi:unnamed protein product [Rotaria socialis]